MRDIIILSKSKIPGKKWTVQLPDGKKVSFGASGYEDYTMHHDAVRMQRYVIRHQRHENWTDPHTAGFWSRWLLWSKPTLAAAIKEAEKRSGYNIKLVRS
jgi:hypothetical protein